MKTKIFRFTALLLALFISLPAAASAAEITALTATPTSSAVQVDGKNVSFDAYNINGNNYFKLRDLAYALNGSTKQFEVTWDGANNAILLLRGKPYTATGGEMASKGAGAKTPVPTNSKILLDGKEVLFTAFNIEGNNYFKLRDIGETFNFGVTWDGAKNTIVIDTSAAYVEEGTPTAPMAVTSTGISSGVLGDTYGMRGKQQSNSVPTRSFPLSIKDAPSGTVSYAVIMLDPDSKPLCGYEWVHWLAANITSAEIAENASIDNAANMVQGKNDFGTTGYGGPTPPDKPHTYKITVVFVKRKMGQSL